MELHFVQKIQKTSKKHQKHAKMSKNTKIVWKNKKLNEKQQKQSNLGKMHETIKNMAKSMNSIQIHCKLNKNNINHMICIKCNKNTQQPNEIMRFQCKTTEINESTSKKITSNEHILDSFVSTKK